MAFSLNPFQKTYTQSELDYFRFLSRVKLFERLTKKQMLLFRPYLHLRNYRQNEVVFFRNDPSQALYLIKTGQVTMSVDIGNRFETVSRMVSHASIGNNCLVKNSKRIYNAVVTSPVGELYVIPQFNILNIFERRPLVKSRMMESLAELMDENFRSLFVAYRSNHGFFDLEEMFRGMNKGC